LTPKELAEEIQAILATHPEISEHQVFASSYNDDVRFPVKYLTINKRNQLVLED